MSHLSYFVVDCCIVALPLDDDIVHRCVAMGYFLLWLSCLYPTIQRGKATRRDTRPDGWRG